MDLKVAAMKIAKKRRSTKQVAYVTKGKLIALIADEDTVVGFLLGGIGEINDDRKPNFMIVDNHTTAEEIGAMFQEFYKRGDIDIILIAQICADLIRPLLETHIDVVPTVLEIPSKYCEYDPNKDSMLKRAKGMCAPDDSR